MTDWKDELHEGDPLRAESDLAPGDVDRMKRAMLTAARGTTARPRVTWQALTAAAIATVAVIVIARLMPLREAGAPTLVDRAGVVPARAPALRQLQFSTRGGTRVIWVFDDNFDVRSR